MKEFDIVIAEASKVVSKSVCRTEKGVFQAPRFSGIEKGDGITVDSDKVWRVLAVSNSIRLSADELEMVMIASGTDELKKVTKVIKTTVMEYKEDENGTDKD